MISRPKRMLTIAMGCLAAALAGCQPTCPPLETVVPVERVVDQYNANARAIPRLWARARTIRVTGSWGGGLPLSWDFYGTLLLAKGPETAQGHDFVLIGKEAGQEVFRLGSSLADGLYYYWMNLGDQAHAAFGRLDQAGAPNPAAGGIDPLSLLAVLTVAPLPTDDTQPPLVGLRMSESPCAYVLTVIDRQPVTGRILLQRDIYLEWTASGPGRPFQVRFYDDHGREVMSAELEAYRPVDVSALDDPPELPPHMPTDITLKLTDFARRDQPIHRIRLLLTEMQAEENRNLDSRWDTAACRFRPPPGVVLTPLTPNPAGGQP